VDLLLRWGSLLSTLAHGALEVRFGPRAATPIAVEPEAIERILVNLVRNAAAATRNGGAIRIGVGVLGSDRAELPQLAGGREVMVLTVDDSGDGMTEQQVERALGRNESPASDEAARQGLTLMGRHEPRAEATERFVSGYGSWPGCRLETQPADALRDFIDETDGEAKPPSRVGSVRSVGPPHGLGLAIVRGLVRASGGSLSIHSRPGLGTRIEMRWPTLESETVGSAEKSLETGTAHMVAGGIRQSDTERAALQRRSGWPSEGFGEEEIRSMDRSIPDARPGRAGSETVGAGKQLAVGREGAIAC
jgi:hypothetical protein